MTDDENLDSLDLMCSLEDIPILFSYISREDALEIIKRKQYKYSGYIFIPKSFTFHRFLPLSLGKVRKQYDFDPFMFQYFYFAYKDEWAEAFQNTKNDVKVAIRISNLDDIYVIDIDEALKYKNSKSLGYRSSFITDDGEYAKYYKLQSTTFRLFSKLKKSEFLEYKNPVFLLQRGIISDTEIYSILSNKVVRQLEKSFGSYPKTVQQFELEDMNSNPNSGNNSQTSRTSGKSKSKKLNCNIL